MAKQKIEIEVEIPEGWEFVRWGVPVSGEWYVFNGEATRSVVPLSHSEPNKSAIIQRVKPKKVFVKTFTDNKLLYREQSDIPDVNSGWREIVYVDDLDLYISHEVARGCRDATNELNEIANALTHMPLPASNYARNIRDIVKKLKNCIGKEN